MSHFSIVRPIGSQPATVFSPSISFLRSTLKLPIRRIADALQISETNVGTILSRGATTIGDPGIERLLSPDAAISSMDLWSIYGVRPRAPRRALPEEAPNLDELTVESNLCLLRHRRAYDFWVVLTRYSACGKEPDIRAIRDSCCTNPRNALLAPRPCRIWRFEKLNAVPSYTITDGSHAPRLRRGSLS